MQQANVKTSDMAWYTWNWYEQLLGQIAQNGFTFADYINYAKFPRPCILRHDVDFSLQRALEMARFEAGLDAVQDVHATFFVLLNSEFYNPRSPESRNILAELTSLGHHIGLHFDTKVYVDGLTVEEFSIKVQEEAAQLSELAHIEIQSMSMHRPSQALLAADLEIPGIVNTYSDFYFHKFKYISDSGLFWRENPYDVIASNEVRRLHLLIHPVWYSKTTEGLTEKLFAIGDKAGCNTIMRFGAEVYPRLFDALSKEEIQCHFHSQK